MFNFALNIGVIQDNMQNMLTPFPVLVASLLALSCAGKPDTPVAMADPSGLEVLQLSETSVKLTWKDNARGEKGYYIYLRSEGSSYYVDPLETLPPDTESYTFTGLKAGASYFFGVQAMGESMKTDSG